MQSANESQSQHEPTASRSSILGLDALTFLMADVRDGAGPYLSGFSEGRSTLAIGRDRDCHGDQLNHSSYLPNSGRLASGFRTRKVTFGRDLRTHGRPRLSSGCLRAEARRSCQRAGYFRRCFGYHSSGSGCAESRGSW